MNEVADNLNFTEPKISVLLDSDIKTTIAQINTLITHNLLPNPDFADYGITAARIQQVYQKHKLLSILSEWLVL